MMNEALTTQAAAQLVPASYAEKAMASLMQLHSELMDEKEKRVDLFRRLMEREQALAEMKMYVKMLEEKLNPVVAASAPILRPSVQPERSRGAVPPRIPTPPPPPRARIDGWKTW